MTSHGRTLLWNVAAMLALGFLQRGMGLVSVTVLARLLGVSGVGAYAFVQSTSQTFFSVSRCGLDAGLHVGLGKLVVRGERARIEATLGEGLSLFCLIAVVGAVVMSLLSDQIAAGLFHAPQLASLVKVGAVVFFALTLTQFFYTAFAGLNAFVAYARISALSGVLLLVATVAGGFIAGVDGAVWGLAAANLAGLSLLGLRLKAELSKHGLHLRPRWPAREARSLLGIGFPFYANGLLLVPVDFLCMAYLSRVAGVEALGDLRATQTLMSVATLVPAALAGPFVAQLAGRLEAGGSPNALLNQIRAIWILSLCLVIGLGTLWPFFIDVLFGTAFAQARTAGVVALTAFVPTMLLSTLTGGLLAMSRSRTLIAAGIFQAAIVSLCAYVLIPRYGLAGYLACQTISMAAGIFALMVVVPRHFPDGIWRAWMVPLSLLTLVLTGCLFADQWFEVRWPTRLSIGLCLSSFLVVACGTTVLTRSERNAILSQVGHAARDFLRPN
ncbi:oligosaccharide flippase family protein [Aquabacter spiritensis]|uniref:O-antigen/teichoic acid export membrane protein n=1 Tax=Aquabacter spiritensis TaxID=933073 RepID=A0A4R3LVK6_9HYPH|nr:oligosaccharide flippase family protein [Aquabacter spiritensis]TCT04602.1 O-antigen/teichoic acid export membrane protein [Aquabacter spiritensis]